MTRPKGTRVRDDAMDRERPALVALAFRMLGTLAEAEDAVQETYVRWYRLGEAQRAEVDNPAAWLTRVAGRVCLDVLGSARRRRESYLGPWLPEPLPSGALTYVPVGSAATGTADPLDRVTLDESVSTALLLVLESMTPAERVAFVLHDAFAVPFDEIARIVGRSPAAVRQLASSARRRVRSGRTRAVTRAEHDAVVRDFAAACGSGDLAALTAVLDPAVTLRSDGGGVVSAARNPIVGPDRVARFLLGVTAKVDDTYTLRESTDGLCVVASVGGRVRSVVNAEVRDGRIVQIWTMLNPAKLSAWPPERESPPHGAPRLED